MRKVKMIFNNVEVDVLEPCSFSATVDDLTDNKFDLDKWSKRTGRTDIKEYFIVKEMEELNKDFIQELCGAVIPNIAEKKSRFQTLHNEYRVLLGKEPRVYKEV